MGRVSMMSIRPLANSFGCILQSEAPGPLPDKEQVLSALNKHRAVLLRGFKATTEALIELSNSCCSEFSSYVGGGLRLRALDRESVGANGTLLSTSGGTQGFSLPLHGEMYYQRTHPDVLWFYCHTPASERGQTTLADGNELYKNLSPETQKLLTERDLLYIRNLSEPDWKTTFCTDDIDTVVELCRENEVAIEKKGDRSICIQYRSSALQHVNGLGPTFINNAVMVWQFEKLFRDLEASKVFGSEMPAEAPFIVRWHDRSQIPEWVIEDINMAADEVTIEIQWQPGDIVIVDNGSVLHGRRKTTCRDRKILVRMGQRINLPNKE
jgi:alpha-ketoglutarate-dependent taurine dioxygenase